MTDQVTEPKDKGQQESDRGLSRRIGVRSEDDGAGAPATEDASGRQSRPREAIFGLEDVQVSYGPKPAVRGVTFDIGKNEITAFIGPSGCGKSTLMRCSTA